MTRMPPPGPRPPRRCYRCDRDRRPGWLYEGHVLGHRLRGDARGDHLLPRLPGEAQRPLVSGSESVRLDVGADALGEGDPRRLVTDLEHVPAAAGHLARHHMQMWPGTVGLGLVVVVHRDAPINRLDLAPSLVH